MKILWIALILLVALSCQGLSSFRKNQVATNASGLSSHDFQDHYVSLIDDYIQSDGVSLVRISNEDFSYFNDIYTKILQENTSLIKSPSPLHLYIINSPKHFYFSLPRGNIFFSLGLFQKYFKSEDIFIACFTLEILKSNLAIYPKYFIVPLGHMNIERLLYLTKIPLEVKSELNKWSFLAMKRAGHNYKAYLQWLQMQNKNILDFAAQIGDSRNITREEFLFKNFVIKEGQNSYTRSED